MKTNSSLSGVLHVVLHLARTPTPVPSSVLAEAIGTHPVVIRRLLAGLRDRGFVRSEKGHGGGWTLDCDLEAVTLRDVYASLEAPPLLALGHRGENPSCLVEQAVNHRLGEAFREAEELLLSTFEGVTLGELNTEIERRIRARQRVTRAAWCQMPAAPNTEQGRARG